MNKRQTGRSTRMLNAAIESAKGGGYSIVYCANPQHRTVLMEMALKLANVASVVKDLKIYLKEKGQLTFEIINDRLDLRRGLTLGAHPSCKVFADHYALEAAFPWLFAEHERYDLVDHTAEGKEKR